MELSLKTKIVAVSSALCFLISLYVFGVALDKNKPSSNDFSISMIIANKNGMGPGIVAAAVLGTALLIYLHYLREVKEAIITRSIILSLVLGLYIAIIYVSPYDEVGANQGDKTINDAHGAIAFSAFTLLLIYNIITYSIFYKKYKTSLPIILIVFNILIYIGLFVPIAVEAKNIHKIVASGLDNKEFKDSCIAFAAFEHINYLSIIVVILFLGFYKVNYTPVQQVKNSTISK